MNKESRRPSSLEDDIMHGTYPFMLPSWLDRVDQRTRLVALRISVIQLDLARRVLRFEYEAELEVRHAAFFSMIISM
jgi:hypothetical protein